jgi:serine/threonine-protein kinase HipA
MIADTWRVVHEWRGHFEPFGVPAAEIEKLALGFRHIDDVCSSAWRKAIPPTKEVVALAADHLPL